MAFRLLHKPPAARPGAPDFNRHGQDWPHRDHSAFAQSGAITWHIQRVGRPAGQGPGGAGETGDGPVMLLLHGTGASTHSWAELAPLAGHDFHVVSVDLPGHGFTQASAGFQPSIGNITTALADLLAGLNLAPSVLVGHSAGAALALALAARLGNGSGGPVSHVLSINGALTPFPGLARVLFPATAQVLSFGGLTAHLLAQSARDRKRVQRLLDQTGGAPAPDYVDRYWTLLQQSAHIAGTLRMMASWDLVPLSQTLLSLEAPVLFLAGSNDRAVDPSDADTHAERAPNGRAVRLDRLGHLAHEQDAARVWQTLSAAL